MTPNFPYPVRKSERYKELALKRNGFKVREIEVVDLHGKPKTVKVVFGTRTRIGEWASVRYKPSKVPYTAKNFSVEDYDCSGGIHMFKSLPLYYLEELNIECAMLVKDTAGGGLYKGQPKIRARKAWVGRSEAYLVRAIKEWFAKGNK